MIKSIEILGILIFKLKHLIPVSLMMALSTGVTIADVNNDGLLDIYVSCELYDDKPKLRTNKLYINQEILNLLSQQSLGCRC